MTIKATIDRIRCHTLDPVPTGRGDSAATILAIEDLLIRLRTLVTIDDNAPSAIDGYPTKTPGARPPEATGVRIDAEGNVIVRTDDEDNLDVPADPNGWHVYGHLPAPPDTIVETSAIELVTNGEPRDVIHRIRLQAEEHAEKIAHSLTILAGALARYDKVRLPLPIDTPQCFVAAVIHSMPLDAKWIPGETGKRTKFDGVLDVPWRKDRLVCRWTYDFTRRWRRLPTRDEMLEYLETGYVRMNETIEAKSGRSA